VTVVGLILFGVLHNVLELRYVLGRFGDLLAGRVGVLLVVLVTGIVLARLAGAYVGVTARTAEILLGYTVLAAGAAVGLRGWARLTAWAVLLGGAAASLSHPASHVVVLAHLHNLVPLVFLWDWSRRLASPGRWAFRAVQVGWVLVVPAAILLGAVDRWVLPGSGVVTGLVGDGSAVVAASAWPGTPELAVRMLVGFAFLQTMHYVVWVWFLPRAAPEVTAAFEARWPALTSRRVWAIGLGLGVLLAALLLGDYGQGRTVYAALASYHAYLEFPVLLALLARPSRWRLR